MSEKPSLNVTHEGGITIISFTSQTLSFDEAEVEEISDQFGKAIEASSDNKFVLNFEGVEYMSSNILGMLVSSLMKIMKRGGSMRLAAVDKEIMQLFQITGLHKHFQCSPTVASAVESLKA